MTRPTEEELLNNYFAEVKKKYDALPDEEKRGFTDGLSLILGLIKEGHSPQEIYSTAQDGLEVQDAWMASIAERLRGDSNLEKKANVIIAPADRYTVSYWDYEVREVDSTSQLEEISTYLLAHPHEAIPIRVRVKISNECSLDYLSKWSLQYDQEIDKLCGSPNDPNNWNRYWGPHPTLDVDAVFETEESAEKLLREFEEASGRLWHQSGINAIDNNESESPRPRGKI